MTLKFLPACSAALIAAFAVSPSQGALIERPTNFGIGADAEVRDWQPFSNFGFAPELAVRILNANPGSEPSNTSDRNDLMFMRIDLSGITLADVPGAIFRLSYGKDNNLNFGREKDPITGVRAGLLVYGLNPTDPGNNWNEGNITYDNAPGVDWDISTGDYDLGESDIDSSSTTLLGNIDFPDIAPQNWFPVGGDLDLSGPALEAYLTTAINAGAPSVTFIAGMQHDGNPAVSGVNITNRTYLFVHKGITTLNDPSYDSDTTNPSNPLGGPHHLASNASGQFSPRLVLNSVPEPTAAALTGLAAAIAAARRRSPSAIVSN